jgi:hypothetical protein
LLSWQRPRSKDVRTAVWLARNLGDSHLLHSADTFIACGRRLKAKEQRQ